MKQDKIKRSKIILPTALNVLQYSTLIINLFFCFIVINLLYSRIDTFTPQIDWELDFKILLLLNTLLILFEQVKLLKRYVFLFIILRAVVIGIILVPYPDTVFIDAFLVTGLYLSFISHLKLRYTPAVSFIFCILYLMLKIILGYTNFGFMLSFGDIIMFSCFFGSFSVLYLLARYGVSKHVGTQEVFHALLDTIDRLTAESSQFLKYAADAEENSSIEERKRITRELHDIIGKTFTDVIMIMEANMRNTPEDPDELKDIFSWVGEQSRYGLYEIRKVLYDLRASIKEEPVKLGSIKNLTEPFSNSTHVAVDINWANARVTYGPHIDKTIYYIIQESMINALRHGNAKSIRISFWESESSITVTIQDDGKKSLKAGVKGLGQTSMEERLARVDGSIKYQRNTEGYQVQACIPLDQYGESYGEKNERASRTHYR